METTVKPVGAHVVLHRRLSTGTGSIVAVLLCKRTLNAPIHPGHWSLFGGKLETGETSRAAAKREVLEELGIDLDSDAFDVLGTVAVDRGEQKPLIEYFACTVEYGMDELTLQPNQDG